MRKATVWEWVVVAVLALSPWPLGGRLPWVSMVLASITIVAAAAYTVPRLWRRQPLRWIAAYGPMAGFLVWVGAQWGLGLSVYPYITSYQWLRFLSYAAFFVLCVELLRSRAVAERLLPVQVGVAFAVGLFSLVQFFTWNGLLYWVYESPYGGVRFGPFNNNNYFPAYMVPALAPALALLWSRARRDLDLWLGPVVGVGVLAVLMARSRSGAIALGAMVVSVALLSTLRREREERNWLRPAVVLGVAAVLIVVAVFGLGRGEEVLSELETIASAGTEASFVSRLHLWRTSLTMTLERPLTGFGLGTFGWVLMPYRTDVTTNFSMHAHNEYLEALVETGIPGLVLVLAFLALLLRDAWARLRHAPGRWQPGVRLGALSAWLGILAFAMLDFPSVLPATDYLLAFLAAVAVGDLAGPSSRRESSRSRRPRGGGPLERRPGSTPRRSSSPEPAPPDEPADQGPAAPPVGEPEWARGVGHPFADVQDEAPEETDSGVDGENGEDPDRSGGA